MTFRLRKPLQASPSVESENISPLPRLPPGVIVSAQSGHPVTSWGLKHLDIALNGGIPLSTLTLVVEDSPSSYHIPLISYVTAQGIQHGHAVAIASFATPVHQIISSLPGRSSTADIQPLQRQVADMKIAWRYKPELKPDMIGPKSNNTNFTHEFDLSVHADAPHPSAPVSCIPVSYDDDRLENLLKDISSHLTNAHKRHLFSRIIIHSLPSSCKNEELISFVCRLRTLARRYGSIAIVSIPSHLPYHSLRAASDAILVLDSFHGLGAKVAGLGSEWLGVMTVKKSYRFGKGSAFPGRGDVWVFKRGRRKYTMERATCAPDDEERHDDSQSLCGPPNSTSSYAF